MGEVAPFLTPLDVMVDAFCRTALPPQTPPGPAAALNRSENDCLIALQKLVPERVPNVEQERQGVAWFLSGGQLAEKKCTVMNVPAREKRMSAGLVYLRPNNMAGVMLNGCKRIQICKQ